MTGHCMEREATGWGWEAPLQDQRVSVLSWCIFLLTVFVEYLLGARLTAGSRQPALGTRPHLLPQAAWGQEIPGADGEENRGRKTRGVRGPEARKGVRRRRPWRRPEEEARGGQGRKPRGGSQCELALAHLWGGSAASCSTRLPSAI